MVDLIWIARWKDSLDGCPKCGRVETGFTVGGNHFRVCDTHRVMWCHGDFYEPSWRDMDEEWWEARRKYAKYQEVDPVAGYKVFTVQRDAEIERRKSR
jgi:hypothetical protein